MNRRRLLACAWAGAAGPLLAPRRATAAEGRPLAIVIPFAPGGASDIVVRTLSDSLAQAIGRPVIAENRAGAGGLIAVAAVARAGADGDTLLYGNQGQIVVARHLFPAGGPDPLQSLVPLTQTARTQFLLVVPATAEAPADVAGLLRSGRGQRLRFGVPGIGSPPHLAAAMLGEKAGLGIDVVPYQGSAPLQVDLIAGRIDAAFDNVAAALPHVRGGRLRALGVSGAARAAVAPDVPTVAEAGVAGFAYQAWQGVFAPRGTAADRAATLADALQRTLALPAVRTRLQDLGLEVVADGPAAFEALIARDSAYWDDAVKRGLVRAG